MTGYRDEREALHGRVESLEEQLAQKAREVDALRGDGTAEERLERLAAELAAAQAEIAQMRAVLRPRRSRLPVVAALGSLVFLMVAGGAAFFMTRSAAPPVAVAPVAVTPPGLPQVPAPPTAPQSPTAAAPAELTTSWKGQVKSAKGGGVTPGTPCVLSGHFTRTSGKSVAVDTLSVICGTRPLYLTTDALEGMSQTSWDVAEEPAKAGGFQHRLLYQDQGTRSGARNQVSIDTGHHRAKIWREGAGSFEVELQVDELDAPQPNAIGGDERATGKAADGSCERFASEAKVKSVSGAAPVAAGAKCEVTLRPAIHQCNVVIECGGHALYDGFAAAVGARIVDDKFSVEDHDPKLVVELAEKRIVLEDAAVTSWKVELELASPGK